MAQSNGAAGKARSEVFAKCTQFGLPRLFFTVTPEDHCNLRIQVMRKGEASIPPDISTMARELLSAYKMCAEGRTLFPSLCALDFSNVVQLVVRYVLGWNTVTQEGENGAFGKIVAFYMVGDLLHATFTPDNNGTSLTFFITV